jgi:pyruvate/2-oxoglutarate/acetoin dehydrogenase E1 component
MLKHVTKLSEDASVREVIQETAMRAVDSKAVAASVAATTAALGLSDMQSMAQLFATIAAGILSVVLVIKHGYDVYRAWKSSKTEDSESE